MRGKTLAVIVLALLLVLSSTPVFAQDTPEFPQSFYGTLTINDSPAAPGASVEAIGDDVLTGIDGNPIVTDVAGSYGSADPLGQRLIVQGDIEDGATLTFYVNGYPADQDYPFDSGETTELNLTVIIPPTIGYSPSSFSFTATEGGDNPSSQTLSISNTGVNPLAMGWSVSDDAAWLSFSPASGSSSGELDSVTLSVSISGMSAGSYPATITLSAPGATNTPQPVAVSLTIAAPPEPEPPLITGGGGRGDTTPPTFSNILASSISETTADIAWRTNEPSTSQVEYWTNPSLLSPLDEAMVTDHLVHLTDLTPGITYHYKTMSRDATGNLAVSDEYTFFTLEIVILPAPAAFSVSDLYIQPAEVEPNEVVTIIVSVANTGGTEGSYSVVLKINDVKEEEKVVTVAAGSSKDIIFIVTREDAASYNVVVDGLSGDFTIVAPAPPAKEINWPLIGGIIGGVIVVGLGIFFLVRRRGLIA